MPHYKRKKIRRKRSKLNLPKPKTAIDQNNSPDLADKVDDNNVQLDTDTILQLQGTIGNQAVQRLISKSDAGKGIQRTFTPAVTTGKTHLRDFLSTNTKIGRNIPSGTELVVDPADTKTKGDETWTRAVDTAPGEWDPSTSMLDGGYIRGSKMNTVSYPKNKVHWNEAVGLYTIAEKTSARRDGSKIIKTHSGQYSNLDDDGNIRKLTEKERTQVAEEREKLAEEKLDGILRTAAVNGGINPDLMATQENIEKLKHPLRLELASWGVDQHEKWFEWSKRVYAKITSGAGDVAAAIMHWRSSIYPPDVSEVGITKIEIDGSDLHDKGLGTMFVTYTKPADDKGMFPGKGSVKVVIKPEDRSIEKALFGHQEDSLANKMNELAELDPDEAITTIKMQTHENYGSLIEFVQGEQARSLSGSEDPTNALTEAIAFAFLTGMSDVHQDNVIWKDGKPYFIDADNSLNAGRMQEISGQTGFTGFNKEKSTEIGDQINEDPSGSSSKIIQKVIEDATPFVKAIKAAFSGKTGRIVPLYTNYWANRFKQAGYIQAKEGDSSDVYTKGDGKEFTQWRLVDKAAQEVVKPQIPENGVGFAAEAGVSSGGEQYYKSVEREQTKADLDEGKIPFYTYEYSTGHIKHNDQTVWHGQSIDDAMEILLKKFPVPKDKETTID